MSRVAIVSACCVAAAVPVRGDLNDGLACYWSFDEGFGVIVHDGSPNGYDGTRYGAQWVEGRVQGALSFDGVNDFVQVPDAASTPPAALGAFSQGSIALWFKVDTLPPSPSIHPLFSYGTGSSLSFLDRVIIEVGHMGGD